VKTTPQQLDLVLRQLHVFSMTPNQRTEIAGRLAAYGITVAQLRSVFGEARSSSRDDESARGLFANTLRDPSLVKQIADDVEDRIEQLRGDRGADSQMAHVSESNPYGWPPSRIEQMRMMDHERPGEWNTFRQGFNMTVEEARLRGIRDVRRHGCSRVEIVGDFDKERIKADEMNSATATWIPSALQPQESQAPTPDREVYGG
jgi:hypothetical protein